MFASGESMAVYFMMCAKAKTSQLLRGCSVYCLSTKKPFENVKLANNDFQGACKHLTSSFVSLTEERFSEHINSVVQNILLS